MQQIVSCNQLIQVPCISCKLKLPTSTIHWSIELLKIYEIISISSTTLILSVRLGEHFTISPSEQTIDFIKFILLKLSEIIFSLDAKFNVQPWRNGKVVLWGIRIRMSTLPRSHMMHVGACTGPPFVCAMFYG